MQWNECAMHSFLKCLLRIHYEKLVDYLITIIFSLTKRVCFKGDWWGYIFPHVENVYKAIVLYFCQISLEHPWINIFSFTLRPSVSGFKITMCITYFYIWQMRHGFPVESRRGNKSLGIILIKFFFSHVAMCDLITATNVLLFFYVFLNGW